MKNRKTMFEKIPSTGMLILFDAAFMFVIVLGYLWLVLFWFGLKIIHAVSGFVMRQLEKILKR